jgi:hypothetical protein
MTTLSTPGITEQSSDCETVRDCTLPDSTTDEVVDGEVYSCRECGREYQYRDGWFTPVGDADGE